MIRSIFKKRTNLLSFAELHDLQHHMVAWTQKLYIYGKDNGDLYVLMMKMSKSTSWLLDCIVLTFLVRHVVLMYVSPCFISWHAVGRSSPHSLLTPVRIWPPADLGHWFDNNRIIISFQIWQAWDHFLVLLHYQWGPFVATLGSMRKLVLGQLHVVLEKH